VEFTVKDVMADGDAAEFLESRGIYATPVLQVHDELVIGFQREKIDRLLGKDAR
jgi:DNA polymerase I-like protein with 3'-5' exonuclease and polymerase domains